MTKSHDQITLYIKQRSHAYYIMQRMHADDAEKGTQMWTYCKCEPFPYKSVLLGYETCI